VNGKASFNYAGFSGVGAHSINAVYVPEPTKFAPSTSATLSKNLVRYAASVAISATPNPVNELQPVAIIVQVSGAAGTPTGPVSIYDGAKFIGTFTLDGSGQVSIVYTPTTAGVRNLKAVYGGDALYATANAIRSLDVRPKTSRLV
jgi:hypothetical protein